MKPQITVPDTQTTTPEPPATPRDSSQSDWLRHATALVGALGIAGATTATSAFARKRRKPETETAPATGTAPTDGMAPMTAAPADGTTPTATAPADGTTPMTGTMGASQAVESNSVVPGKGNPNNPALTIPASGKKATTSDVAILNFALGLEYLEATFYAQVVAAHQAHPYLTPASYNAAQKLAQDEAVHVEAILEILTARGATPVAKPAFKFPPAVFISNLAFLDTASAMEETGVGAYLGGAPQVQDKDVLKFAASVYGIETRHASLIRLLSGRTVAPNDVEIPLSMDEVLKRVQPFLA